MPLKSNRRSPAYSFVKERLELEFQRLHKEKLTPWAFFLTDKGVMLKDFFGRDICYVGGALQFNGSPRDFFWMSFIQPFLNDIVSRNFSETERFCREKGLDWKLPLQETASLLKNEIAMTYERMADIDQRLRGKGYPKSVSRYNPKGEIAASVAFVDERYSAEIALPPNRKGRLNQFYEEQKFWVWIIGIVIAVILALIKFLI
jgi:hypothetical protein